MKRSISSFVAALIGVVFFSVCILGCSDRSAGKTQPGQPKPVAPALAAAAANSASEAEFAMQIRDYSRAAQNFEKALEVRPDIPAWWESLAVARKLQGKPGDAKSAYKKALSLWEDAYEATGDAQLGLHQVVVLLLLNRTDDARELVTKLGKKHPKDPALSVFIQNQGIDRLLNDPEFAKKKI